MADYTCKEVAEGKTLGFHEERAFGPLEEVCELPSGATLYRQTNPAGGHSYWSDEVGGGVMIWDTCLAAPSTLMAAITEEWRRRIAQKREQQRKESI